MIPFDIKDACLWANTTILTKLIHRVRGPPCGDGAQHRPGAFPGPAAAVRGPPRGFWRALAFSRRSDNESRCNRGLTARSLAKCTPGPRLPWPRRVPLCPRQWAFPSSLTPFLVLIGPSCLPTQTKLLSPRSPELSACHIGPCLPPPLLPATHSPLQLALQTSLKVALPL